MKKLLSICFLMITIVNIIAAQSAWIPVNSQANANLNSIYGFRRFEPVSAYYYDWVNRYYVAGDNGTILISTNSGDEWASIPTGITENLNALNFSLLDSGIAVGNNGKIIRLQKTAGILTSVDISMLNPATENKNLNNVMMIEGEKLGYVVGDSGLILRTTNRGNTWVPYQTTRVPWNLRGIDFKFFVLAWAVGDSGTILKSTKSKVWNSKMPPETFPKANFRACTFIADTGWIVGENGAIAFTKTGGNIFSQQFPPQGRENTNFNDVFFGRGRAPSIDLNMYKPQEGYIVGDSGLIMKTTDYGIHWIRQESGTTKNLHKIFMLDSLNGIIVGDSGLILKTTRGGNNSPKISIMPRELQFGTIKNNSTKNGSIIISNTGVKDLIITSIISSNPAFVINQTNLVVPMNDFREVGVTYYPSGDVDDSASISITGNFSGSNLVIKAYGSSFDSVTTGWIDQNPMSILPKVKNIGYSDSTLISVGEMGTMLISKDNGISWIKKNFIGEATSQLNCFKFVNSSTGIAVGRDGVVLKTNDGGNTWSMKQSNTVLEFIDIDFRDEMVGYLLGRDQRDTLNAAVYRTSDGGETWNCVKAVSNVLLNTITTVGQYDVIAVGVGLLRSDDDGNSWECKSIIQPYLELKKVIFFDNSYGLGTGDGNGVALTSDGGILWSFKVLNNVSMVHEIIKAGQNSSWAYGSDGSVYKTDDRGINWQTFSSSYYVRSISKIDDFNSVAIGYDLKQNSIGLLRCENGIPIEKIKSAAPIKTLFSISFSDHNNGAAAGLDAALLKTTDGGNSWSDYLTGSFFDYLNIPFLGVQSVNDSTITCVGYSGAILRTTNSGTDWQSQQSGVNIPLGAVQFLDELNGYCVGDLGLVLHTTNGGNSWLTQYNPTNLPLYALKFIDLQNGIAVGGSGIILQTSNGGVDWTPRSNGTAVPLLGVDWLGNRAIAVGYNGIVLLSTDGGSNWQSKGSNTNLSLNSILIKSDTKAFIAGDDGIILHTSDGGLTWNKQLSGTSYNLYSIYLQNDSTGTIVGENGIILHTTNGGGLVYHNKIGDQIPEKFTLEQNYPNPFNPTTNFQFSIVSSQFTILKVYDVLGREVEILVNELLNPGTYNVKWDATKFSSGVYFYRLQSGKFTDVKKMILAR